jgi:hypothetical protein
MIPSTVIIPSEQVAAVLSSRCGIAETLARGRFFSSLAVLLHEFSGIGKLPPVKAQGPQNIEIFRV